MPYSFEKSNYKNLNPYFLSSIDEENLSPDVIPINSTIKALPKDKEDSSNLNIETGEIAFLPSGELLKARGIKHSEGGMNVNLPEDSFIYSDYKPLAIKKEDKELFKFKEGGKYKPKNNTPAKILTKEIDLKHHNRMIAIQGSDAHDNISKKSSELMINKNFKKAGQIAFLQEEAKNFPDGLPEFSEGTAPVEDPIIAQQSNMATQFKQVGGPVWAGDRFGSRKRNTPSTNATQYSQNQWDEFAKTIGFNGEGGPKAFQKYLYNYNNGEYAPLINSLHDKYKPGPNNGWNDGNIGYRWDAIYRNANQVEPINSPSKDYTPLNLPTPTNPSNIVNPYTSPSSIEEEDILPYEPSIPLTPDQKLSLGLDAYQLASINKYAPKRAQNTFTPVNLERINSQPYINTINNQTQQAYKANQVMNPYIARANNSQIYGQGLSQISQTLGNIDNQNSQISNQENLYNNQGINNTGNQNIQLDNTYYNQVQALNQNSDNEHRFAQNRLGDQYMQYRSQNDALKFNLASQPTFGTVTVYQNPSTGELSDTPKEGWIPRKQAKPLYDYNSRKNSVYYTGAGIGLDQLPTNTQSDPALLKFQQAIINGTATEADKLAYSRLYKSINPYTRGR